MPDPSRSGILVVDDSPIIRDTLVELLVEAGYDVQVAADGLEALAKMEVALPALVISDLRMPRMSGEEFLHIVRKRFPHIPTIAIGAGFLGDEMPADVEADAWLEKESMGIRKLHRTIDDLIRNPPPRPVPLASDPGPARVRRDELGRHVIDCPHCLRFFTIPDPHPAKPHLQTLPCVHCKMTVAFSMGGPTSDHAE